MNNYNCDRLDALLTLAAAEYAKELTNEFLSATSDCTISEQTERRIMRMIQKDKRRTIRSNAWKVMRYIMIACLIATTLIFSACMAIPRLRQAIWKAIVEWHDEYVSVQFVPSETDATEPSDTVSERITVPPNIPTVTPPDSVEEINPPSYMPIGYTTTSTLMKRVFILNYFDENESFVFSFRQMVITSGSDGDAEEGISVETTVNSLSAVVITYDDQPNVYNLYWQDSQYRYNIYGYFTDYNELMQFATSVEVK